MKIKIPRFNSTLSAAWKMKKKIQIQMRFYCTYGNLCNLNLKFIQQSIT